MCVQIPHRQRGMFSSFPTKCSSPRADRGESGVRIGTKRAFGGSNDDDRVDSLRHKSYFSESFAVIVTVALPLKMTVDAIDRSDSRKVGSCQASSPPDGNPMLAAT